MPIGSESVEILIPKPETSAEFPKTFFVVCPVSRKVRRFTSPLKDSPPTAICFHVAVNKESSFTVWVNAIHFAFLSSNLGAVCD